MKAIAIIPARYNSTRFPGKAIVFINGKPLIQYVYEGTKTSKLVDKVLVATDDKRIYDVVRDFSGEATMTSNKHISGTDRIAEVADNIDADVIVNVQGDEPLIKGEMVDDVIKQLKDNNADMGTLKKSLKDANDIYNPNIVKVVTDIKGFALYFSRAPIPYYRNYNLSQQSKIKNHQYFMHIGIYSYRRDILLNLTKLPQSELEKAEKLEQLRALENGYKIKIDETDYEIIGVDTEEDLKKVEECLQK